MNPRFQFSLSQVLAVTALAAMGFWATRGMETSVRWVFAICACYAGTCFGGAVGVMVAALGGMFWQRFSDQKEHQRLTLRIRELEETLVMHAEGRRLVEEGEVDDLRYRLWVRREQRTTRPPQNNVPLPALA